MIAPVRGLQGGHAVAIHSMRFALFVLLISMVVLLLAARCSNERGCDSTGPGGENHPPVMQEIRDTTAVLGDTLWIPIEVSDPDGDELHFELLIECTWDKIFRDQCPRAGIRRSVMKVWFWPRIYDFGLSNFMAVVDDGRGGSDSTSFSIAVYPWTAGQDCMRTSEVSP